MDKIHKQPDLIRFLLLWSTLSSFQTKSGLSQVRKKSVNKKIWLVKSGKMATKSVKIRILTNIFETFLWLWSRRRTVVQKAILARNKSQLLLFKK